MIPAKLVSCISRSQLRVGRSKLKALPRRALFWFRLMGIYSVQHFRSLTYLSFRRLGRSCCKKRPSRKRTTPLQPIPCKVSAQAAHGTRRIRAPVTSSRTSLWPCFSFLLGSLLLFHFRHLAVIRIYHLSTHSLCSLHWARTCFPYMNPLYFPVTREIEMSL